MGPTKLYIEQCRKAGELAIYKRCKGFNEGDYILFEGKGVLIGHDFLNISAKHNQCYTEYVFAMIDPCTIVSIDSDSCSPDAIIKHGTYVFKHLRNPVWLPTTDQLQECLLLEGLEYTRLLDKFVHFTNYHNSYKRQHKTKEQLWLEYFMFKMYKLVWNFVGHTWVYDPSTLSEG